MLRPLTVWLIVLSALLLSSAAGAYYGASKAGSVILFELSCKLMAQGERDGILDARKRRELIAAAGQSAALSPKARNELARIQGQLLRTSLKDAC